MKRREVEWARELTQGLVNEKGVMSTAVCLPLHCAEPKGNEMMAWGVAQLVECLPSTHKVLGSTPTTT